MSLYLSLLAALLGGQTLPAGFDCAKATTRVEKTICGDAELSALDGWLTRFYLAALDRLNQSSCLKSDQRAWLADSRNRCQDAVCLRAAYLQRLAVLSALQPGMNIPNNLELPPAARLRWIIPPAADTLATPKLASAPYRANGTLGYVLNKGGYVLDTGDGIVHTLIPELLIDDGSSVHLGVLRDLKTKISVSGRHAVVNKTEHMFDNRYCILIYEQQ